MDFAEDLGLVEGEYLVHEYWSDTFYGIISGAVTVPACGCAVLAIWKKTLHPEYTGEPAWSIRA